MLALPTPVRVVLLFWLATTSAATTSNQVAGYVASGLGLSKQTSTSSTSSYRQNTTNLRSPSYSNTSVTSIPVSETSTSTASQDISASLSKHTSRSTSQSSATGSITTAYATTTGVQLASGSLASSVNGSGGANGFFTNTTYNGDCWTQWNEYWNASYTVSMMITEIPYTIPVTLYTLYTDTESTETTTLTTTSTISDGPYAVSVTTITSDTTLVDYDPAYPGTSTFLYSDTSSVPLYPSGVVQPNCTLPSYVPACQSSWEGWAKFQYSTVKIPEAISTACRSTYNQSIYNTAACDAGYALYSSETISLYSAKYTTTPGCSQATITGSICSALTSSYLASASSSYAGPEGAGYQITQTCEIATCSLYTYWPASTQFAPGCTLGCQSCRITAGTVQLMYWPPATTTYANGTPSTAASNDSNAVVTTVLSGNTLTSPTVYISFDSLYASDSCGGVGPTRYGDIVAITNSADLSSLYGWNCFNDHQLTASFNFADLYTTPVPYSIYLSQPRCQWSLSSVVYSYYADLGWGDNADKRRKLKRQDDGDGYVQGNVCGPTTYTGMNWTCPTSLPYLPIIAVPTEVQDLEPGWASCLGGLNGAYDPPKALQGASVAASVTTPLAGSSTTLTSDAQPASSATPTLAKQTTTASLAQYSTSDSASDPLLATQSTGGVDTTTIVIVSPSTPTNVASSAESSVVEGTSLPTSTTAVLTTSGDPEQSGTETQSSESAAPYDPGSSATGDTPASSTTEKATSTTVSSQQQSGAGTQPSESAAPSDPGSSATGNTLAPTTDTTFLTTGSTTQQSDAGAQPTDSAAASYPGTVNALSVLSEADSSYLSATTDTQASASQLQSTEGAAQTHSQDPAATASASEGAVFNGITVSLYTTTIGASASPVTQAVYSATSGEAVTVVQQGSSYVVNGGGRVVTLGAGQSTVVNGETVIAPSNVQTASVASVQEAGSSTSLRTGETQALAGPTTLTDTISSAQAATYSTVLALGTDSITVSVDPSGHDIVDVGSTSFTLIPAGPAVTVGSDVLSEASNGALVAQSGSLTTTVSNPHSTSDSTSPEAVVTVGGHTLSAIALSGGSLLVEDATSTMTLSNGATATFEDQTIVAASGGSAVVVDGTSTVSLTTSGSTASAVTETQQSQSSSTSAGVSAATGRISSGGGHLAASLGMTFLFGMVACLI